MSLNKPLTKDEALLMLRWLTIEARVTEQNLRNTFTQSQLVPDQIEAAKMKQAAILKTMRIITKQQERMNTKLTAPKDAVE